MESPMKKLVSLLLSLCLVFGMLAMASAETETRTASAPGFGGDVTVTVTLEDGKIVGIDTDWSTESFPISLSLPVNTKPPLTATMAM